MLLHRSAYHDARSVRFQVDQERGAALSQSIVREKIDRGIEDVEQSHVISQKEVERRMRKRTGE